METKIKAVAFDFDGVIAETTQLKSDLFLKMFEGFPEFALILDYEKKHQSLPRRRKLEHILSTILNKGPAKDIDFYIMKYAKDLEAFLPKAPLIKGFESFVESLQSDKIHLFIVSSGLKLEIEKYLGPSRTRAFEQIFDASTPKPLALRQIMSQCGLRSSELLFLGDSSSDYQAAHEAPCEFVAVNPNVRFPAEVKSFADFSVFDPKLLR